MTCDVSDILIKTDVIFIAAPTPITSVISAAAIVTLLITVTNLAIRDLVAEAT